MFKKQPGETNRSLAKIFVVGMAKGSAAIVVGAIIGIAISNKVTN